MAAVRRTVFPSCRVASTVTTTAGWEGTRTPTWPCPPATACSKSMVPSHICCVDKYLQRHSSLLLLTRYPLPSLPFAPLSPGSGMFDDGAHMYQIEPLRLTHSSVSYSAEALTRSVLEGRLICAYLTNMCFSITFSVNQWECFFFSRKQLQGLTEWEEQPPLTGTGIQRRTVRSSSTDLT